MLRVCDTELILGSRMAWFCVDVNGGGTFVRTLCGVAIGIAASVNLM
jgi:hypothetical protein